MPLRPLSRGRLLFQTHVNIQLYVKICKFFSRESRFSRVEITETRGLSHETNRNGLFVDGNVTTHEANMEIANLGIVTLGKDGLLSYEYVQS